MSDTTTAPGQQPSKTLKVWLLVLSVLVLVLTILVVTMLVGQQQRTAEPPTATATPTSSSEESASDAKPSTEASADNKPWRIHQDRVLKEVAPGLNMCETRIGEMGRKAVNGVPIKFPRTMQGGISAAINWLAYTRSFTSVVDKTAGPVNKVLYDEQPLTNGWGSPEINKKFQEKWGLNGNGEVLGEDGKVNPDLQFFFKPYPEYGAYRLALMEENDGEPNDVVVQVWFPYVMGPGNDDDMRSVGVQWVLLSVRVSWYDKGQEWLIRGSPSADLDAPQPKDPTYVNQSYQSRADTLGPGWCVAADSVEEALPDTIKAKR